MSRAIPATSVKHGRPRRANQWYAYVSSASVYADDTVPGQNEDAKLLPPIEDGDAADPELYGSHKVAASDTPCKRSAPIAPLSCAPA